MSSKPSKTSFEKTTSKLDSLISTLEEKTGMTRELLKAEQEKSSSAQGAIKSNVPVSKAPQPKVEETKVEQKKDEKKQVEKKEEQKTEKKDKKKDQKEQGTEQKAEKKEKKEKKTSAKPAEPTADQITAEDFARLDIRVGKITECWKHPESDYLYCEKIDIGEEVRSIGSGLQNCVPISEMTSDLVLILANLKERKLGGYPSHGMVLCAGDPNGHYFELLRPHPNSKLGERVTIDGLEKIAQEKGVLIDPKKNKALETVLPKCKVDENGVATFLNLKFKTSAGEVKAKSLKNMPIS